MKKTNDILNKNRKKVEAMRSEGINLFPNEFNVTHSIEYVLSQINDLSETQDEICQEFIIAGRIMSINSFGKSAFVKIKDRTGTFQVYIRKDKVGETPYNLFKRLDIGDFICLNGSIFKTKTEEWTLFVSTLKLVCKSIRPLPEKFHGLKDPEKRYRQRYIDLIANPGVRDIFIKRSQIIQILRSFFLDRGYIEVETPMMHPIPGGAEATPFRTHHNALNMELFLRIAPELYLKRLVIGGFERVFEINRNFRNEGISSRHNPEFTMLEFYQAYATYEDLMKITEEMFAKIAKAVTGSTTVIYQDKQIKFAKNWQRISMFDALEKIGELDSSILGNKEKLLSFAQIKGIKLTKTRRLGKIITKLFETLVEPKLIQPTFVTGYPVEVSPLSRKNASNSNLTDRFELFIAGQEIANGFSELNDPQEQNERFMQQAEDRKIGDTESHHMDNDYIEALEYGMPPTAGQGIGIDRLVMLLTNSLSIREVILFPHMRPIQNSQQ